MIPRIGLYYRHYEIIYYQVVCSTSSLMIVLVSPNNKKCLKKSKIMMTITFPLNLKEISILLEAKRNLFFFVFFLYWFFWFFWFFGQMPKSRRQITPEGQKASLPNGSKLLYNAGLFVLVPKTQALKIFASYKIWNWNVA